MKKGKEDGDTLECPLQLSENNDIALNGNENEETCCDTFNVNQNLHNVQECYENSDTDEADEKIDISEVTLQKNADSKFIVESESPICLDKNPKFKREEGEGNISEDSLQLLNHNFTLEENESCDPFIVNQSLPNVQENCVTAKNIDISKAPLQISKENKLFESANHNKNHRKWAPKQSPGDNLLQKVTKEIENKIYKCNSCSYETTIRCRFLNHFNQIHNKRNKLNCQFCSKSYAIKIRLEDHLLKQHRREIKSDIKSFIAKKIHACKFCTYKTSWKHCLSAHFDSKHNKHRIKNECQFCDKWFLYKYSLDDHLLKQHRKEINGKMKDFITSNIHTCNMCTYKTIYKKSLNEHLNLVHNKHRITNKCQFCDKMFLYKPSLDEHLLNQHKTEISSHLKEFITRKIHACNICTFRSTEKSNLNKHIIRHRIKKKCQFCNKSFTFKYSLDNHLLKQHKMEIKSNMKDVITSKILICNICAYKTTHRPNLVVHMKSVHNKQRVKKHCQFCEKSFLIQASLDDHLLKQHKGNINKIKSKIYHCYVCSYQTTHKCHLSEHINVAHNEQRSKINCQVCDKSFLRKSSLDDHLLKKHEKEIKGDVKYLLTNNIYTCNFCSYKTTCRGNLKTHNNRMHNKQRIKSKCQFCGKLYVRKCALDNHMLKHHKPEVKGDMKTFITTNIHTCHFCTYQTTTSSDLKKHTNAVHNKHRIKNDCQFCNKLFALKFSLQDHMLKKHKKEIQSDIKSFITSKIHICTFCTYETTFKNMLGRHIIARHKKQKNKIQCQFCDRSFAFQTSCDNHLLHQHNEKITEVKSKIHHCHICSFKTTQKGHLTAHFDSKHNDQRSKFNCQFCYKSFIYKSSLDDHLLKQHKKQITNNPKCIISSKIHKCNFCAFKTTTSQSLKKHKCTTIKEKIVLRSHKKTNK